MAVFRIKDLMVAVPMAGEKGQGQFQLCNICVSQNPIAASFHGCWHFCSYFPTPCMMRCSWMPTWYPQACEGGVTQVDCGVASGVIQITETLKETITIVENNPQVVDPGELGKLKTQLQEALARVEKIEPSGGQIQTMEQAKQIEAKLSEALTDVREQINKMGTKK